MPDIQYSESPNETTAFVVDGDRKNRAVLTAAQDTSTIEYPSNPNSTKAYVTVDGKKHRVVMTANIAGGGSGGGAVSSVNGQTGDVVLDAEDVGALPANTPIPETAKDVDAVPQYETMPTASEDNLGEICQYSGETTPDTPAGFSASQTTGTGLTNITVNGQVYIDNIGEPLTADKTITFTVDRIDNAYVGGGFGYDDSNYPLEVINLTEDAHYDPDGVQVTLNVNDFDTLIHSWWTSDNLQWDNMYLTFDGSDWTLSIYDESQEDYAHAHTTNDLSDWGITVTKGTPQSGIDDYWSFYPQTPVWFDLEYEYENSDTMLADFWGLTYSGTAVVGDVITWVYKLHGVSGVTNGYFYKSVSVAYPASASITQDDTDLSDLAVDADVFATQESDSGYYIFEWNNQTSSWTKQETGETVNIADYGITYTGTPYGGYAIYVTFIAAESGYVWNRIDVQPASSGGENINWVAKADLETGENPTMILRITGGLPDGEYEFYTQVKNNYYDSGYSIGYITCKVLLKLTTEEGSQYPTLKATLCPVIDGNWAYKTLSNFASGQTVYFVDGDIVLDIGGIDLFSSNIPSNTGYSLAVEDCYKVSEFINTATNEKYIPQIEFEAPQTYDYTTSVMFQVHTIDQMPVMPTYFARYRDSISSVQYIQIGGVCLNDSGTMDIDVNLACGFDSFQAHIHLYDNGFYKITKQKATSVFENTQFVTDSSNNIFVKLNAPVGASGSLYIRIGISNSSNSLWINTNISPSTETLLNITEIGGTVDIQNLGDILQYNGTTNASYTNGYFYKATGTAVTIPESVTISEESPSDWTVSLNVSVSDLITAIMNATGWTDQEWIKQYVLAYNWRIDVNASDNNNITNVYIANYGDVSSGDILSCFSVTTTGSYSGTVNVYFRCTYSATHQEVQGGAWTRVDTQPAGTTLTSTTGTLVAANWSGNSQTISVQGVTSSNIIIVGAAPSSQSDYTSGGVICTAQGTDSLTFTCTQTPTNDITVNVIFG